MKKDFIVRRSTTMIDGKPHVETYSEQELVRCKDCKYYHKPEYGFTYGDCTYCSAWRQVSTDDFCSKGRRKDT